MSRYTDADALLDTVFEVHCKECDNRKGEKNGKYKTIYELGEAPCKSCGVNDMREYLEDAPTADVMPVVHGEWEDKEVFETAVEYIEQWQSARCSACGKYHTTPYMYHFDYFNYCPNCGAKMRGGSHDN